MGLQNARLVRSRTYNVLKEWHDNNNTNNQEKQPLNSDDIDMQITVLLSILKEKITKCNDEKKKTHINAIKSILGF